MNKELCKRSLDKRGTTILAFSVKAALVVLGTRIRNKEISRFKACSKAEANIRQIIAAPQSLGTIAVAGELFAKFA